MFMEERQQAIAEYIRVNGKILVSDIVKEYGISDESARRDLRILEQKGICKRTHGGAILLQQVNVLPPKDRDFESMPVFENYRAIAREAAKEICENDTVYLCSGSFGFRMLEFLPRDFHYTVVINSVDLGKALRGFDNVDVYIAGGKMRQSGSVVDSLAAAFISQLHFDICFLTGAGLTADFGLSNGTDETANFQRAVLKNSRKKYLLLSSHKIGTNAFIKVCSAGTFDTVFTDWDCAEDHIAALEECGVNVVIAEENV